MTAQQTNAITDPQSIIAALQQRLDAAMSEKAMLAEELAARTAPGDPQPVFDLITQRARELCNASLVGLFSLTGTCCNCVRHLEATRLRSRP